MPVTKTLTDYLFVIGSRYLIIAGIAFLFWYVLRKKYITNKKIQLRFPSLKDYQREIIFSLITTSIFATVGLFVLSNEMPIRQHTLIYKEIDEYGMLWFWLFLRGTRSITKIRVCRFKYKTFKLAETLCVSL